MGILLKHQLDQDPAEAEYFKEMLEDGCFLCGESLFDHPSMSTGGVVFWSNGVTIGLHQGCAENLAVHLIGDARSLVTQTGKLSGPIDGTGPVDFTTVWYVQACRKGKDK